MNVLQSRLGAGHYLGDSSLSAAVSPLAAAAVDKFVVPRQGAAIAVTILCFVSVRTVRKAAAAVLPLVLSSVASVEEARELLPLLERRFWCGLGISSRKTKSRLFLLSVYV